MVFFIRRRNLFFSRAETTCLELAFGTYVGGVDLVCPMDVLAGLLYLVDVHSHHPGPVWSGLGEPASGGYVTKWLVHRNFGFLQPEGGSDAPVRPRSFTHGERNKVGLPQTGFCDDLP